MKVDTTTYVVWVGRMFWRNRVYRRITLVCGRRQKSDGAVIMRLTIRAAIGLADVDIPTKGRGNF